ncbi:succinyl-diaminopimelate desuccinylase [Streptomyces sp. NPDC052301]|uniref:succinyl-diaminopimelate desuccinylase n=1 Tax=Streptomyces sp. NPDC052301 TaxID=3365687 RepID=UPI0037D65FD2
MLWRGCTVPYACVRQARVGCVWHETAERSSPIVTIPSTDALSNSLKVALLEELGVLTHRLVAMASVSGSEQRICDAVEKLLRQASHLSVTRTGNCLVARTSMLRPQRLLLAGHLDTVPPTEPPQPPVREGRFVEGRGAVDMKAGVAVMVWLALTVAADAVLDSTFVFYDREEMGSHTSGMNRLAQQARDMLAADAAVLLEPTGGWLEPGCQGNMRVRIGYRGRSAHTARPWTGANAIDRMAPALARCSAHRSEQVVLDGLEYPQAFEVVGVQGGGDSNVLPDRCAFHVNVRYAHSRSHNAVLDEIRRLVGPEADDIEVTLDSPAAPPSLGHPLLGALVRGVEGRIRPKLGWTDVGRLAHMGIPAANFGPGDPALAHTAYERVDMDEAARVCRVLARVLAHGGGA